MMLDIAIIGGGLSGLSLARHLQATSERIAVFEAREGFGGRILSLPADQPVRYDLGPSWIWPELQPRLARFISEHGLETFPQWCQGLSFYQSERLQAPQAFRNEDTYAGARRLQGGTYRLIDSLLQTLSPSILHAGHRLQEVIDQHDFVELVLEHRMTRIHLQARRVVLTIPPRLLASSVTFRPTLAARLHDLMLATPTWMAGHAKALIRYQQPFWREAGLSGCALAVYQGAALAEIFDATSSDSAHAALSGFLALPIALRRQYRADLEALIVEQLVRLFGKAAAQPEAILIRDWCDEPFTATPEDEQLPTHHPTYGHTWLQLDHWNDKLYFAGTETATDFGGYLEGALESAERVAKSLLMQ